MERYIVTGAAGFIGSHLCDRLLADGAEVLGVDNLSTGSLSSIAHLGSERRFHFLECDVTDGIHGLRGPTAHVLHLASPASPFDYERLHLETLRAGSVGTLAALELAHSQGAHFLFASTSEVYGDPQIHPQHESYRGNVSTTGPRSVYDESKRFGEAATSAFRRTHGVRTSIVRIFNTYGPRMRRDDGRAVPTFIARALQNEPIPVAGDGTQTRSLCYVDDLVEGLVRMVHHEHPGPMNLGSDAEITVRELADKVRRAVGSSSPIVTTPLPADDPKLRRPDTSLAREVLGWSPRVVLEDGLQRTAAWFADQRTAGGRRG